MLGRRQINCSSCSSCLGSSTELIVLCCLTVPFLRCHQWESASRCTLALPQGNLTLSAGETDCEKTIDPQLKYARAENRLRSLNRNARGLPLCFSDTSPPLKTGKRCAVFAASCPVFAASFQPPSAQQNQSPKWQGAFLTPTNTSIFEGRGPQEQGPNSKTRPVSRFPNHGS